MMEHLARHECENVSAWNQIYAEDDGQWTLDLSQGDAYSTIKFCPYCGLCLPTIADELIQARKIELEEIERNRKPSKPISPEQVAQMMKDYGESIKEALEEESPLLKMLLKEK
jgi:hypothetical protein